ncbi:MAG: PIN domain-containing protein, partial [Thermomicrobiales bacterium]
MYRVVLDTVVLVRGLINPYGVWGKLVFDRARQYQLVISPPLLTEYLEVLARPELARKFKQLPDHMRDLLDLLSQAEIVFFSELPSFERDPN